MPQQTKRAKASLLDKDTEALLADGLLSVTLIPSQREADRSSLTATLTLPSFDPSLDNRAHILQVSGGPKGEVFLSITGIPTKESTTFTVFFQDPVWNNLEWYEALVGAA